MSARTFVDSNVLIKLYDIDDARRHAIAAERLRREEVDGFPTISTNVLGEAFHGLTKGRSSRGQPVGPILALDEAAAAFRNLRRYRVVVTTESHLATAVAWLGETVPQKRRLRKFWDAVHMAVAVSEECNRFLTWDTDFVDGDLFDEVRVERLPT
jgi:predicted nucleic acid-binding protein